MRRRRKAQSEPTITLINIVFLLLIFFLVAGALAPPLDRSVQLVETATLDPDAPPDALIIHADGRLSYRGQEVLSASDFLTNATPEIVTRTRVVPDQSVSAARLIELARDLQAAGSEQIVVVTKRGLQ